MQTSDDPLPEAVKYPDLDIFTVNCDNVEQFELPDREMHVTHGQTAMRAVLTIGLRSFGQGITYMGELIAWII